MERRTGDDTSLKIPKILAVRHRSPGPVGQTDQGHYSSTAAGPAGMGVGAEVPVAAAAD